jgi:DNA polymerase III subunit gamma/tau
MAGLSHVWFADLVMAKKGIASEVSTSSESIEAETTPGNPKKIDSTEIAAGNGKYTVVARRYRPKTFAELVGQSTVSQALLNAIESNRVGHAYLFTGARGVGKTSTARIFAKALNAAAEANGKFDPNSDISQAIDAGEDMDVLEIDGASNRGIDEIRQLRSNASVRPSRSRYKIYIIDEVHMLTPQAFNALLKTLEEPPGHVKFIFCTTDPEKIPITVLSRCQRFDFPPVQTEQIFERLKFICENEGTKADDAALRLIARRAAGSMRDSQSLLEQLLSFSGNEITAEVVHAMLGTADETRLASFSSRLIQRDAAGALRELNTAADEGVDVGQLAEQLLGYLRDIMTVTVGGGADLVRTANPSSVDQLKEWGTAWGTMTLLSALQLLDETIVKMRHSVQSRILLEIALVQICNLQDLQALSDLVKAFSTQSAPPPRAVAKTAPAAAMPVEAKKKVELSPTPELAEQADEVIQSVVPIAEPAKSTESVSVKEKVKEKERQPESTAPVAIKIAEVSQAELSQAELSQAVASLAVEPQSTASPIRSALSQAQLIRNAMVHPLIKQFMDVFEGQVVRVDPAVSQVPAPHFKPLNISEPTANEIPLREALRSEVAMETASAD